MRKDLFTPLRLTFASAVVISHSFALGGFGADPLQRWTGGQMALGGLAVLGFFTISGFLLAQSLKRNPHVVRYCIHRAGRILPGYWAALLLTALVLAPCLITGGALSPASYAAAMRVGPHSALEYLAHNWPLEARQYVIGPLFAHNPGGSAVNGSLWTLYHEGLCYLGLLLLWFFRGLRPVTVLSLWAVVFGLQVLDFADHASLVLMSPVTAMTASFLFSGLFRGFYLAFLGGIVAFEFGLHERLPRKWFWIAAAVFLGSLPAGLAPVVWPFTLPCLLVSIAHRKTPWNLERFGDWSYGIYLYAFPIQQCLALAQVQRFGVWTFILASLALSWIAGALSWHLVERPFLRLARAVGKPASPSGSIALLAQPAAVQVPS